MTRAYQPFVPARPGRIDYQYTDRHTTRPGSDEHAVVFILAIDLGSH